MREANRRTINIKGLTTATEAEEVKHVIESRIGTNKSNPK